MPLSPDERVAQLEARLGIPLPDPAMALLALTHKSFANEHPEAASGDNERLEFLGDAVVDLAVSHRLWERFPQAKEGELSRLRARVVNEEGLATVARALSLGEILRLGKGETQTGGAAKSSLLADALEAVIGSLYLAHGMAGVLAFVDRHFHAALEALSLGQGEQDFKSKLQEITQARLKLAPRYRVVGERGPGHLKVFEVEVELGEKVLAKASGRSKKEAEQAAAKEALGQLEKIDPAG